MTELLATCFGIYMIAAGLGLTINRQRVTTIIDEFEAPPALTYFGGAVMTLAGAALVLTHNVCNFPCLLMSAFGD